MSEAVRGGSHPALTNPPFEPLTVEGAALYDDFLRAALAEDIGVEDLTTVSTVDEAARAHGAVVAREAGAVAGIPIAIRLFALLDGQIRAQALVADGTKVKAGTKLIDLRGPARSILTGERVALNLLGRLSGIATLTRRYADEIRRPYSACIADTRKTTPGLRALERYAVRAGGGANHRYNLSSAVLIKDNHLAAVGGVAEAVRRARGRVGDRCTVEVECETLAQVRDAVEAGADAILLDNMSDDAIREAVVAVDGRAVVEASGSMTPERVAAVAAAGADVISVGALTHGARSLDVAMDFDSGEGRRKR